MFLFRASRLLAELARFRPDLLEGTRTALDQARRDGDFIRLDRDAFAATPSDSIDYAVMERTDAARVLPVDIGWNAPALAPWLAQSMDAASNAYFGRSAMYMGEGGSIPFMGMLGMKFPAAQFLITGVLGPHSNAHGPNEFLHIPTGKKLTCCVAQVIADHFNA